MHPLLKFTLDLFESNQSLAPVVISHATTESIAKEAPLRAPVQEQPGAHASYRHPRANREARLGELWVAYEFKRGQRRTIGFSIGPDGLVVRAPKWVPLGQVDAALQEKSRWILQKLGEATARRAQLNAREIQWCDGATIPYLGSTLLLTLDPRCVKVPRGVAAAVLGAHATALDGLRAESPPLTLQVALPPSATPDQIRAAVQTWLMRQATRLFIERLDHFAPKLQVRWLKLSLSNAKTRWGSARADGSIRLNWRLIHYRQSVIDYVVAHELSHLRVMDHSPRFWATVRSVVPDYAALRQQLKEPA